jgi:hypothetical protein
MKVFQLVFFLVFILGSSYAETDYYRVYPYENRNNDPNVRDDLCTTDCNHNPPAATCGWHCIPTGTPNHHTFYQAISPTATDEWCYNNCNNIPSYCPASFCQAIASPVSSTSVPTSGPTQEPTTAPTATPTQEPTTAPTVNPTKEPTTAPTANPTLEPTTAPTANPTLEPTTAPTATPTQAPTTAPTQNPTPEPSPTPTNAPEITTTPRAPSGSQGDPHCK